MRPRLAFALVIALTLAAGCGGDSASTTTSAPQSSSQGAPKDPAEEHEGGEERIEGFGAEASGEEREEILTTFTGYLGAIAAKDYARACADLSETVHIALAQLAGEPSSPGSCAASLPVLLAPTASQVARQQANGRITKVRVEGESAFVVFEAPGAKLYQQTMVEEGGEWKAATVAAAVLVPEL